MTRELVVGTGAGLDTADMVLNIGPQHPSTHGVLRLRLVLDGERVLSAEPIVGYMHRGAEKLFEVRDYRQIIVLANRHDWLSAFANELGVALAVERLMGLEVPERAVWLRTALAELNRVLNHLMFLGSYPLEIGAITPVFYAFRERETLQAVMEEASGGRMHYMFNRVGGLKEEVPAGWTKRVRTAIGEVKRRLPDLDNLIRRNEIFLARTRGVGVLTAAEAAAFGASGPVARASGLDFDLRRDEPYLAYPELDFDVPVYHHGDVYDRYRLRVDEMRESVKIVSQCLEGMPGGDWVADDRKVVLPPRHELHTSMESLIHHFKIVTEGYRVPEGEVYVAVESPRGEFGCYLVSDGGPKPWRVKFRAPSFVALEATATCVHDSLVADMIAIVGSLDTVMGEVDR
jgi:NADH-quinone oxidoreductase subunit D